MDIDVTLRKLGPVDSQPLIDTMLGQGEEAWQAQQYRQNACEINNQRNHSVMNSVNEDRITFIFDYLPPANPDNRG